MLLKNTNTGSIGEFSNHQGEGWIALTESEILDYELQEAKKTKIIQCKAYLTSTDWEHTAFLERGRAYDATKAKRLLAVNLQDDINACTTIEELNAINIEF